MKIKKLPPIEVLQELLTYCPESGELRWKVKPSQIVNAGDTAGTVGSNGYVSISIKRKLYLGHRIAWALHYGEDTEMQIDHKNGNRCDNRIANLRLVSHGENIQNVPRRRNNTSGHRGVYYNKQKKKWEAELRINGKRIRLGAYPIKEEAIVARQNAEAKYNVFVRE